MINNNVFAALIIFIASLCIVNFNTIEGFMDISGTNARHAYLPQTYKNEMSIRNFRPHGGSNSEEVRDLETFNYNPRPVRNNIQQVEEQFKTIENFQQKNMNNTNHNVHTSNNLPKHDLSETYIPQRPDYELSRGVGVSVVTPMGYRNGARPSYGVDLLRGDVIREGYNSFPQFGSPSKPTGNLRKRGDTQNPDPRGEEEQETGQTGTEKKHGNNAESYVPKAIRRGYNTNVQSRQGYEGAPLGQMYNAHQGQQQQQQQPQMRKSRRQVKAADQQVQQFMDPPIQL
jgi:hypothetical protein